MRFSLGASALVFTLIAQTTFAAPYIQFASRPEDSAFVRQTHQALLTGVQRLEQFAPGAFPETIFVFVAATPEEFDQYSLFHPPDWGAAVAVPALNRIVLKSPKIAPGGQPLEEIVTHELAHLYLYRLAGRAHLPRWIDEGFASWQSGEWSYGQSLVLARANLSNSLIPLEEIDEVLKFRPAKAALAYAQSHLAVQYFVDSYGKGAFVELAHGLGKSRRPDSVFFAILGIDRQGYEAEYLAYLKKHYNWVAILSDFTVLWIFLAFLLILAFILYWRRKRKILKAWQKKESFEQPRWSEPTDEFNPEDLP